jgi:glycosyltransferase involved in cell wall biosynthesis
LPSRLHIALLDYRDVTHPEAGGAEIYLNEIFQRVAARGHRVTLLCASYQGAAGEARIGNLRVLRAGNKATANFVVAREALRLARRERVDLFVENLCKLPFLLPALTKTPVLPILLHLFGHTVFQETNVVFGTYVWLYEKLIPLVYRGLRFVVISESTAHDLAGRRVRPSRIDIVHPGLNLSEYQERSETPRSPHPLLVYVGRLKRYKGIDIVIRAFARVRDEMPDARLVIVGRGDDRARLEALVRSLHLSRSVSLEGYVSEDAKLEWFRRAHVVLYPSPREGWGIASVEAAACGTPVLASDSDGLREAVCDGTTGFLIPHRDIDAWAHHMIRILSDTPLNEKFSAASLEWAQRFDWDVQADRMRRIAEEVASGDRGSRGDA